MATHRVLLCLLKFSLYTLVVGLTINAHQTHCVRLIKGQVVGGKSSRSSSSSNVVIEPAAGVGLGLCASAVTIYGYKCQEIEVITQDGFILNVHRIPQGRNESGDGRRSIRKEPVLLQHGILVDGMTWFMNSAEENLPMILADKGFDVWITNTRGTRFSRRHTCLQPNQQGFWNWSWDELVVFDLPAVVDHVYSVTAQKMHYVGHSMGTLVALASFSQGLLVDKLKSAAFMSPIAYLSHMTTALGALATKAFVGEVTTMLGVAEFNPKGKEVASFLNALCAYPGVDCYDLMSAFTGKNCCLNSSTVALCLKSEPQPTSTKTLVHLSQTARNKVLAKFNYGTAYYNLMHYGAATPPVYNLSNVPRDLPIFLSYGGQDALSDTRDVEQLLDCFKFHDVGKLTVQFVKEYAHADFVMATNAKDIVFNQVVSFFKNQV